MEKKRIKFWEEIKLQDDKAITKINKMIDKKQAKELDRWIKRFNKEGYFWRTEKEPKSKKSDWL